jgi:arsenate reductase (thioredoxin)
MPGMRSRSEGGSLPRVVFVCARGAARSQMAAAFWRDAGGEARSRGLRPAPAVYPEAAEAMAEVGMALGAEPPRGISGDDLAWTELVVRIDCGSDSGLRPGAVETVDWSLPGPAGEGLDAMRTLREAVRDRVARFAAGS